MEQFHSGCYGKNIEILDNGTSAIRTKDYFHGTVFGSLPLKPFQPVSVEITATENGLDGKLRYGFTNCNPDETTLEQNNPYYMSTLLSSNKYTARKIPYEVSAVGHTISYYYTPNQHVFVSFDGVPSVETDRTRDWRGSVDFHKPVWPMLDVHAGTKGIRIVPAPPEILDRGQEAISAFREATTQGTKKVYRTRLMLVGQERVGKTSLMKNLNNESFNDQEVSTVGIETTLSICSYQKFANIERWQSQDGQAEDLQTSYDYGVAENMASINKNVTRPTETSLTGSASLIMPSRHPVHPIIHQTSYDETTTESLGVKEKKFKIATDTDTLPGPSLPTNPDRAGDRIPLLKVKIPSSLKVKMPGLSSVYVDDQVESEGGMNEIPTPVIHALFKEHTFDEDLKMHIWDFAGQDLYYTTHQVFLSKKALYVVVFDLSKDLEGPAGQMSGADAGIESEFGRQYSQCGHHHEFTSLDFLDFWMRSIYSFTIPNMGKEDELDQLSPPIFIVGTHKNSLHPDPEIRDKMVKEKFSVIAKFVARQCYRKHLVFQYYAVENSLGPGKDREVIELKNHIGKVAREEPYMGERIPLRWLLFQMKVQDMASKGTPHITLKEAETLYLQLPGNPQPASSNTELLTMLEFMHDSGQLVYIKDGGEDLHNLVILNPNWLIKVFKEVISVVDMDKKRGKDVDSWRRLTEEGILDDQLVTYLWRDILKCKTSNKLSDSRKNALLQLMKIFDLICDKDPKRLLGNPKCYFVPSRLQHDSVPCVDSGADHQPSHLTRVFYIDFDGFLPDGFFHRMMVRTAKWSQEQGGNEPRLWYRMITLFADDYHKCVLEMAPAKDARVKVLVTPADIVDKPKMTTAEDVESLKKALMKVMAFLQETLSDLKEVWAKRIQYTFGIACQCHVNTFHLLPLSDCMDRQVVECAYKNRTHTGKVKQQYSVNDTSAEETVQDEKGKKEVCLKDVMTETFLFEMANKLGKEWKQLASLLGFTQSHVYHVVTDERDHVTNQIQTMLLNWRRKQPPKDIPTAVKKLTDALKECHREDLADYVQEYVQERLRNNNQMNKVN